MTGVAIRIWSFGLVTFLKCGRAWRRKTCLTETVGNHPLGTRYLFRVCRASWGPGSLTVLNLLHSAALRLATGDLFPPGQLWCLITQPRLSLKTKFLKLCSASLSWLWYLLSLTWWYKYCQHLQCKVTQGLDHSPPPPPLCCLPTSYVPLSLMCPVPWCPLIFLLQVLC